MIGGLDTDLCSPVRKNFFAHQQRSSSQRLVHNTALSSSRQRLPPSIRMGSQVINFDVDVVPPETAQADSRCSTVESITPVRIRVVATAVRH